MPISLEAVRRRDPDAIAALVHAHQRRLRGFVAVVSADLDAVDDLSQEVFLRALRLLDRVTDLENFDRFLRTIARNVIREHARRNYCQADRYERLIDVMCVREAEETEDASRAMAALRHCLGKLPERSRRILDLRYKEGRPAREIAADVGANAGAVRVALLRVRETLLKCMRSSFGAAAIEAKS